MAQNWAICIGINGYEYMPPLRYAENDALVMAKFFKSASFQKVYTFTDSSPEIEDGSRPYKSQPTLTRLKWFLRERFNQPFLQPGDNLWFFFSGHGVIHRDRDYLLAIDSDAHPSGIEETAIAVNDVAERLRRCGATNVILVLDACRNEQGSRDAGLNEIHEPGIITLSSCSRGERSYEIEALEQGAFTYALRESLALTGENNCATVERLYKRVKARVKAVNTNYRKPKQTPFANIEPPEKFYTILLPRQATGQDIQQYKTCAYRAEAKGELEKAKGYWEMLWEIAPGDVEVRDEFRSIVLKSAGQINNVYSAVDSLSKCKGKKPELDIENSIQIFSKRTDSFQIPGRRNKKTSIVLSRKIKLGGIAKKSKEFLYYFIMIVLFLVGPITFFLAVGLGGKWILFWTIALIINLIFVEIFRP
ncbi:MAG: caspase family protein [Spirulinaceae cyanobacterium]